MLTFKRSVQKCQNEFPALFPVPVERKISKSVPQNHQSSPRYEPERDRGMKWRRGGEGAVGETSKSETAMPCRFSAEEIGTTRY